MEKYKVVLGSASPRRRELLANVVPHFDIRVANVDEYCYLSNPYQYVMYTAAKKAMALPITHGELLITADTIVCYDRQIMGKPGSAQEAIDMLTVLNNRVNVVYTGVCLRTSDSIDVFCEESGVRICMTAEKIERYVACGNAFDKAGAYGIQDDNLSTTLLWGSLSNVIGLPIEGLKARMAKYGL